MPEQSVAGWPKYLSECSSSMVANAIDSQGHVYLHNKINVM